MNIVLKPIGVVKTNASDEEVKKSWSGVETFIEIFKEYRLGLKGLKGFSHIFIIAFLHKVSEEQRKTLIVRPRRLTRLGLKLEELPEVGVFATDSPHRPNPIALTIAEVIEVREDGILVKGVDLYNGTPVLDIKPYTITRKIEKLSFPKWYTELYEKVGIEI
ncbi:MAG TPA: tRNA (N6-threonylcarbamoyladenosine(37)-N6)-methyltransferase TrmO [Thermoproteales archaeon]|nr:tRNA (N6-threonylcarbamoyladenosine(37)-N6)-methyltransferase TrmO [Thermoproteales archaeon]